MIPEPSLPPTRYRRAFVVTYGRSGSTLLQGLLNAIPGYLIRGENKDVLGKLQAFWDSLPGSGDGRSLNMLRLGQPITAASPFFGFERFVEPHYAAAFAAFLDRMLCDTDEQQRVRCLGFKEIRYAPSNAAARVAFLRLLYPGCAIIYNMRDPQAVAASEFQRAKPAEYFERFNALIQEWAASDPDSVVVSYEDIVAGSGSLLGLHDFLGEPFDEARHKAVLAKKHSYHSNKKGSVYSNVPGAVLVGKRLRGVDLFIVDKLVPAGRSVRVDGYMIAAEAAARRQFARMLDDQGRTVAFSAKYGLESQKLRAAMRSAAAAGARFAVSFERDAARTYRLLFEDDEMAMTIQADPAA